ncbi:MAG: class I tRNA ligase family protein, partial [Clostridiales bacterium]|nr:class I tRNA ligase family protein [Clostridiales bacterium]
SEEIYCTLCPEEETIMLAPWPEYREDRHFEEAEVSIEAIKTLVRAVRNLRSEMNVPPSRKAGYYVVSQDENVCARLETFQDVYRNLISAAEIHVQPDMTGIPEDAVSVVIPKAVVYVPLDELVDVEKERERLQKEKERLQKELARSNGMLKNEKFLSKAPAEKVEAEKEKLEKYTAMMEDVESRLRFMESSRR